MFVLAAIEMVFLDDDVTERAIPIVFSVYLVVLTSTSTGGI